MNGKVLMFDPLSCKHLMDFSENCFILFFIHVQKLVPSVHKLLKLASAIDSTILVSDAYFSKQKANYSVPILQM